MYDSKYEPGMSRAPPHPRAPLRPRARAHSAVAVGRVVCLVAVLLEHFHLRTAHVLGRLLAAARLNAVLLEDLRELGGVLIFGKAARTRSRPRGAVVRRRAARTARLCTNPLGLAHGAPHSASRRGWRRTCHPSAESRHVHAHEATITQRRAPLGAGSCRFRPVIP